MSFRHNVYTVGYAASSRSRRSFSPLARVATESFAVESNGKSGKTCIHFAISGKEKGEGREKGRGREKKERE